MNERKLIPQEQSHSDIPETHRFLTNEFYGKPGLGIAHYQSTFPGAIIKDHCFDIYGEPVGSVGYAVFVCKDQWKGCGE